MKKRLLLLLLVSSCAYARVDRISRANRRVNSKIVRNVVAESDAQQPLAAQPTNGDEERYADKRASYGKALRQLDSGLIDPKAFAELVVALNTNEQSAFNTIPMGTDPIERRLVDPQSAFAYNLNGADSWIHTMPAPPALTSAEFAAEMVEVYWMALMRDVNFNDYSGSMLASMAIAELNGLSAYQGIKPVTAQNLFRANLIGAFTGPYISQFLYLPVPIGPEGNTSGGVTGTPGVDFQAFIVPVSAQTNDFMTTFTEWHFIQQGHDPLRSTLFTSTGDRTFIRNGRDLSQYVHDCYLFEPYIGAGLILNAFGAAALDQANPYLNNPTQEAFATYNFPDLAMLIGLAADYALRAAWYQKWLVHRRLRPEFAGFLAHQQKTGAQNFGLHSDLIDSDALDVIFMNFGTYFLPQAFPEGSPTHPSYPQGHSTVAGACATILKALFNEDFVIPNPIAPNAGNTALEAFMGEALTVLGELNKLALNTSIGRDHAGVHYDSDCLEGLFLGEKVAIALLEDEAFTRNIPFRGYTLTKFDGTTIRIGGKKTISLFG